MFRGMMISLWTLLGVAVAQPGAPASVFVEPVTPFAFANRIEALGTLAPNERVDLTLNAADRVTAVYFEDGMRVEEGRTLLSLAQREQVALTEGAEATLEEARRQLVRLERLAQQNAVSESELDQARRNRDSAEANLRAVQSRQRDRVLVAPFDGVLGFRNVSVGSFIRPGDVVATLIDDSVMRLEFAVPSIFLTSVTPGTPIIAQTDDLPAETFEGSVTSIDNAIDPVTRSFRVRATLPNDARQLRAGMFMTVTVRANARTALSVPEGAVEPVGVKTFIYVVTDANGQKVAARREIGVGTRQNGRIEVTGGLSSGDVIVSDGLIRVRDGAPIVVRDPGVLRPGLPAGGGGADISRE